MARAGVFEEAGGLSFHPYALSPKGAVELCDSLAKILAEENSNGEIWITEIGYPTKGWFPTRVQEKNFPSHIVKTLSALAARNVKVLFWYELYDSKNPGEYTFTLNSESFFGIAYPNNTIKTGYNAFALCGRNLAGKEYRPELPLRKDLPKRTVSLCFMGQEAGNVLILWNESGKSYHAKITLPGRDQRVYDIGSGEYTALKEDAEIIVTQTPIFITWTGPALSGQAPSVVAQKRNF